MLVKEKILSVLNKEYYSDLIKYNSKEELERSIEEYLGCNGIVYDENILRKLSNMVIAEGECVIQGVNYKNAHSMTLQSYKNAIMKEIRRTNLSNVDHSYKRRILDIIWDKLYRNYYKKEVSIELDNNIDISQAFKRKIKEISNENTVIKYAKNTLKKEDGKLKFTIFVKY